MVATQGEQIEQGDYKLVKINSQSDVVEKVYDEPVMDFAFDYNIAYLYNYDYSTGQTAFKVFDLTSGTVLRSQFITDGTNIERPFSIQVNPYSSNVYITEAYNYQVDGDLLCFTPEGTLMFRLSGIGLNPNTVLFRDEAAGVDTPDNPDESDEMAAYADKVFDYVPAPTQYMNTVTTAYAEGFTTKQQVLDYAAERLRKKSLLSLGAYGGYIVLGFSQPVPNVPGEYDFKIYGNANYNPNAWQDRPGGSAEPGIVLVSKDETVTGCPMMNGTNWPAVSMEQIPRYVIMRLLIIALNLKMLMCVGQIIREMKGMCIGILFISSHRIIRFGKRVIA